MTITTFLGDRSVGMRTGFTTRPVVMGTRGVVTSGHYLATAAGFRMMEQGGNAIDAAAAMCFCLNLLEPQSNGLAGEVPTLIYSARERKAYELSGMGWSAQAFTIDWCREHGIDLVPGDGYLPACVPAVVGTWAAALARFGTMSFSEVVQPAIELAENGYPVYDSLHNSLASNVDKFTELYPSTGEVYLPGGKAPGVGELHRNPDWAETLRPVSSGESGRRTGTHRRHRGRARCLLQGRDRRANPGLHRHAGGGRQRIRARGAAELRGFRGLGSYEFDEPVSVNYHGLDVHKCSSWTQGPVFLQQLTLLEGFDLAAMGHNSTDYLHTLIECAKLAFADREAHYGDPKFDDVPFDRLLSTAYADERGRWSVRWRRRRCVRATWAAAFRPTPP